MDKITAYDKFMQMALKYGWSLLDMNIDFCIIAPDLVRLYHSRYIPIFHVDPVKYPFGIRITDVEITLLFAANYTLVYRQYRSNTPSSPTFLNTIESINLAGQGHKKVSGEDIDNPDIAAGNYIFVYLPPTNIPWVAGKIIMQAKTE